MVSIKFHQELFGYFNTPMPTCGWGYLILLFANVKFNRVEPKREQCRSEHKIVHAGIFGPHMILLTLSSAQFSPLLCVRATQKFPHGLIMIDEILEKIIIFEIIENPQCNP